MSKIIEFKAVPERCVFSSDEFRIYGVSVNISEYPDVKLSKYQTATIKGNFQQLSLGIEYTIKAEETCDKYGITYAVKNIKREKLNGQTSVKNFLNEILTKNQTDTLLEVYPDIVERVIKNRLDDIDLNKTKGIKEITFNKIKERIISNYVLCEIVEEFHGLVNISMAKKIYEKYPSIEKVREQIRKKPYECLCNISGVGFKTADALLLGIDKKSKENIEAGKKAIVHFGFDLKTSYQRMSACVNFVLTENESNGNTYMNVSQLKRQCEIYAKESIDEFPKVIMGDDNFVFDKQNLTVSKRYTYSTEKYIAEKINEAVKINTVWDCDYKKYGSVEDFELTDEQKKTSEYMCKYNIVILNGFGGTGKSSSTKALINMLDDYHKSYLLLAPTGRAAKVLKTYTEREAQTIHRGLGCQGFNDFGINKENQFTEDIIIVDEFSMVDIFLFAHLLDGIDFNKTKLLIIGDDAQIPSVGAGNVLYDLLESKLIPTITLDKIFRYGKGGLTTVTTDVRMQKPFLNKESGIQYFGEDKSFVFIPMSQEKMVSYVVKLYEGLLDKGYSVEDIGVLSCYNVGDYGTEVINNKIQEKINPKKKHDKTVSYGDTEFRLNDIVMRVKKNDYKAIIYDGTETSLDKMQKTFIANGESGIVTEILYDGMVVKFDENDIYIPKTELGNISLAYCISTHKSQGGQYPVVIFLTPKAHTFMLNSNLLYVGDSRAKKQLYNIGDYTTINRAIKKKENYTRNTLLSKFMKIQQEKNDDKTR